MHTSNISLRPITPQESNLSTSPKPKSVNRQHQELTMDEELNQLNDLRDVRYLYKRNLPNAPDDTSISANNRNQLRRKLLSEEELDRLSDRKKVPELYERNLPSLPPIPPFRLINKTRRERSSHQKKS
jgi:hypothetical protein